MVRQMRSHLGFTLIELVVSFVIIGILAIAVLPLYMHMQRDARIAAVNGLQGAVRSADALVAAAVIAKGLNRQSGSGTVYHSGSALAGDSTAIRIYGGHPDSQLDGIGNALQGARIGFGHGRNNASVTVIYGAFTVRWSPNNVRWEYTSAPTPAACMVSYSNDGNAVSIASTVSGC